LHQGNSLYHVAWEHDEPLGHAYPALTDPSELQYVSVRLEQRRRGIATALTAAADGTARDSGFERLRLEVSETNEVAPALDHSCGIATSEAAQTSTGHHPHPRGSH
jgi:GNAT superfamily N-acetyltransferase